MVERYKLYEIPRSKIANKLKESVDRHRNKKVILVEGPVGCGKTTKARIVMLVDLICSLKNRTSLISTSGEIKRHKCLKTSIGLDFEKSDRAQKELTGKDVAASGQLHSDLWMNDALRYELVYQLESDSEYIFIDSLRAPQQLKLALETGLPLTVLEFPISEDESAARIFMRSMKMGNERPDDQAVRKRHAIQSEQVRMVMDLARAHCDPRNIRSIKSTDPITSQLFEMVDCIGGGISSGLIDIINDPQHWLSRKFEKLEKLNRESALEFQRMASDLLSEKAA